MTFARFRPRILLFLSLLRGKLHRLFGFVLPIRAGVFVDIVLEDHQLPKFVEHVGRIVLGQIDFVDLVDEEFLDRDIFAAAVAAIVGRLLVRCVGCFRRWDGRRG